jgi:hypothetical protein
LAAPPRLGIVAGQSEYDAEVAEAWSAGLARLQTAGATIEPVSLPDDITRTAIDLQGPEAVANHIGRSTDVYQPDVQLRLKEAAEVPAWRYVQARRDTETIRARVKAVLDRHDAVVLPTVPLVAPPISAVADLSGSTAVRAQLMRNTRLANLTGFPAITLPLPVRGLPVGLQVIAKDNETAAASRPAIQPAVAAAVSLSLAITCSPTGSPRTGSGTVIAGKPVRLARRVLRISWARTAVDPLRSATAAISGATRGTVGRTTASQRSSTAFTWARIASVSRRAWTYRQAGTSAASFSRSWTSGWYASVLRPAWFATASGPCRSIAVRVMSSGRLTGSVVAPAVCNRASPADHASATSASYSLWPATMPSLGGADKGAVGIEFVSAAKA